MSLNAAAELPGDDGWVSAKTDKPGPGRRAGMDSVDTRERVINAACRCFAQYGYAPTTNSQIAEMAGVTAGSVYYHYGTKNKLFEAVLDDVHSKIFTRIARVTAGEHSVRGLLRAVLAESMRINRESPELAAFVASAPIDARRHPELAAAFARTRDTLTADLVGAVRRGQDGGLIPADVDPARVSYVISTIADGFAHAAAAAPPAAIEEMTALFDRLLLSTDDEKPQ